jgi:hypothetical protein
MDWIPRTRSSRAFLITESTASKELYLLAITLKYLEYFGVEKKPAITGTAV